MVRVLVLASVIANVPHLNAPESERMREIAATPGRPYRDVAVEYPVGDLFLIYTVGAASADGARILLALIAFAADIVAWGVVVRGWGAAAGTRYLLYGAPLLVFIYRRSDLVAVACAAGGLAWARRGREDAAGVALGLGFLLKVWPLVILPVLALQRRSRAVVTFALTAAAGLVAWWGFAGTDGFRQVTSFRGATGWELESSVGSVVWALTGAVRFESGANRTGSMPGWSRALLLALLGIGLVLVWWRARDAGGVDPAGAPSTAAVALLLVLSPVLSPQYLCWLVPWAAIAATGVPRVSRPAVASICVTGALVAAWYLGLTHGHPGWSQVALTVRNLLLLSVPLSWLWAAQRSQSRRYDSPVMTNQLCARDAYLPTCDATVVEVRSDGVVLDRSVFYAKGGGQPGDTGILRWDGARSA